MQRFSSTRTNWETTMSDGTIDVQQKPHSAPPSPTDHQPQCDPLSRLNVSKKKTLSRRVSFPEDDGLVTGYLEPPVPWLKSVEMCAEDVIGSYRESCKKHNVAPSQKIISQIKEIKTFDCRNEKLDLSGEYLDPAHCEALEEIFKRIQFIHVNLEACYLEDVGSMALFDMFEFYESVTHLNISRNTSIASRGWHACSRMLKKTPCVEYLNASYTAFDKHCLAIVCHALRLGSNLSVLNLEGCDITGKTLTILVAALKMNTTISELNLSNNKLKTTDGQELRSLLNSNSHLKALNLHMNSLQDAGIRWTVEGLCGQPVPLGGGLKSLTLSHNGCSSSCMVEVSEALRKTSLEVFDLSENDITNDGIYHLKEGLMKNRSLVHLSLRSCNIMCEGAIAIAEFVADNTCLQSLDLRHNNIKMGGCLAVSLSMKVNSSITSLKLDLPQKKKMDDNICEYTQLLNDIFNYCTRNKQMVPKDMSNINNNVTNSSDHSYSFDGNATTNTTYKRVTQVQNPNSDIKNSRLTNSINYSSSPRKNSRFQVSRVHLNSHNNAVRFTSGMSNGRFKVSKVNSVSETGHETDCDRLASLKVDECENANIKQDVLNDNDVFVADVKETGDNDKPMHVDDVESSVCENGSSLVGLEQNTDNQTSIPSDSHKKTFSPPAGFINKRRVTVDGHIVPEIHKRVHDVKGRRKSTPSLGSNRPVTAENLSRNILKLTWHKRLDCLDLRSCVPLSPGRIVESYGLPESSVDAMMQVDETLQTVITKSDSKSDETLQGTRHVEN
ncbi:PPP1R37 (predicted) [Pycnogonum litorale]